MENFARLLLGCGIVTAALSMLLLGYNQQGSAPYVLCLIDLIIGFIMFAFGAVYLVKKRRQK